MFLKTRDQLCLFENGAEINVSLSVKWYQLKTFRGTYFDCFTYFLEGFLCQVSIKLRLNTIESFVGHYVSKVMYKLHYYFLYNFIHNFCFIWSGIRHGNLFISRMLWFRCIEPVRSSLIAKWFQHIKHFRISYICRFDFLSPIDTYTIYCHKN